MKKLMLEQGDYREERDDQKCAGFTILETAIAMLIMFVAVLASVSVFVYAIQNNSNANDRELSMAVAQRQMEQLRSVRFTDDTLTATSPSGAHSSLERAGRSYMMVTNIQDSNIVDGLPTMKTITLQVAPTGNTVSTVTLRAVRVSEQIGPNR
jgi:type II secretory pathway pseudopilin PulG